MQVDPAVADLAPPYLSINEACRVAQISRSTFYRILADDGSGLDEVVIKLPGIRKLIIPKARFIEWIENATLRRARAEGT